MLGQFKKLSEKFNEAERQQSEIIKDFEKFMVDKIKSAPTVSFEDFCKSIEEEEE